MVRSISLQACVARTVAAVLAGLLLVAADGRAAATRDPEVHFFSLTLGDLKAEIADARKSGKRGVMIMFEQDGCPGCIFMHRNVLNRVDVQEHYRARFTSLSINIFGSVPVRDLAGREHTEKSFAQAVGIKATPTFLFYDLQGNEAARIVGPVRDPREFMLLGEFVASGAWKSGTFSDYRSNRLRQ
jgi:thioredoxin-related protein